MSGFGAGRRLLMVLVGAVTLLIGDLPAHTESETHQKLAAATAIFDHLPSRDRQKLYLQLMATGDFNGRASPRFDTRLYDAIVAFQRTHALRPTGIPDPETRSALNATGGAIFDSWGFEFLDHPTAPASLAVPTRIGFEQTRTARGYALLNRKGTMSMDFSFFPAGDASLAQLLANLTRPQPGRRIESQEISPGEMAVAGQADSRSFYTRYIPVPGGIAGFTLAWDRAAFPNAGRIAAVMANELYAHRLGAGANAAPVLSSTSPNPGDTPRGRTSGVSEQRAQDPADDDDRRLATVEEAERRAAAEAAEERGRAQAAGLETERTSAQVPEATRAHVQQAQAAAADAMRARADQTREAARAALLASVERPEPLPPPPRILEHSPASPPAPPLLAEARPGPADGATPQASLQALRRDPHNLALSGSTFRAVEPDDPSASAGQACDAPKPFVPWPPPQATNTLALPTTIGESLGDVDARLTRALERAGYGQFSYFSAPGGFSLATQVERISAAGVPEAGDQRWNMDTSAGASNLIEYVNQLIYDREGYYRIFVFVLSTELRPNSGEPATFADAQHWGAGGCSALPYAMRIMRVTSAYHLQGLSYIFLGRKGQTPVQLRSFLSLPEQLKALKIDSL